MTLQTDEQTRQLFSAIRQTQGQAFVNPLASVIETLVEKSNETITFIQSPDFSQYSVTVLIETIESVILALESFLAHTNQLSGVSTDAPELFSFQTRVGILQSVISLNDSGIDPTLVQTNDQLVQTFFGTLESATLNLLRPIDNIYSQILSTNVDDFVTVEEQQILQDELNDYQMQLALLDEEITNTIQMDNQAVQNELQRVSDFAVASTLQSQYNQNESLRQVYDLVLDPTIQQLL